MGSKYRTQRVSGYRAQSFTLVVRIWYSVRTEGIDRWRERIEYGVWGMQSIGKGSVQKRKVNFDRVNILSVTFLLPREDIFPFGQALALVRTQCNYVCAHIGVQLKILIESDVASMGGCHLSTPTALS